MSTWVSTQYGNIGIAAIKDTIKNETRVRALPVMGANRKQDEKDICDWGGTIAITDLKKIIKLAETNGKLSV